MKKEDAPNADLEEAWEHYHTPHARYPTSPGWATTRSLSGIVPYDAFTNAEAFLTQPLCGSNIVTDGELSKTVHNEYFLSSQD
jgi:hypothetical protein